MKRAQRAVNRILKSSNGKYVTVAALLVVVLILLVFIIVGVKVIIPLVRVIANVAR